MRFNRMEYSKITLALLSMIGSTATLAASQPASQPANDNTYLLKSPSYFFSRISESLNLKHGHAVVQLGGYWSIQGKAQHVNIEDLIGDDFTVSSNNSSNGLVGLGYFLDGQEKSNFKMSYGVNFFYLPKTGISGTVVQESLFTNLSYGYNVTHYPVYAIAKSTIDLNSTRYALTADIGIGPNFMSVGGFQEQSLDNGVTIPDHIFSGRTTTTFSATAGFGIKLNHVFGEAPLECGYRFFYLGQGNFNVLTNQVVTHLNTGAAYGNAVMCAITI